jgi:hypothetical protein
MSDYVYRFRSTYALLNGFHELENQEIYFASPEELNDPLEGFKDIFWRGDVIVWENLIRHYLLCLMQSVLVAVEHAPDNAAASEDLPILLTEEALQPATIEIFRSICAKVFTDFELADLPALLAGRESSIRRTELLSLLWLIHYRLLKAVCQVISPQQPLNSIDAYLRTRQEAPLRLPQSFAALNQMDRKRADAGDITDQMTANVVKTITQAIFIGEYNGMSQHHGKEWNAISSTFPEVYVNQLEKLLYFDWYTACFVAEPSQAAMWGNYGDGHRGVCLKFRTSINTAGKPALPLRQIVGITGSSGGSNLVYDFRPAELQEVQYRDRYAEIDFFRSLGRLTHPQLAFWFTGKGGAVSSTGLDLLKETEEWRQEYWDNFHQAITTKLTDWQHEQEYRITLHSDFDLSDRLSRKLPYRLENLQGIIFGMKTPTQDKIDIVRIIEGKCRKEGREKFEFHQAYYSRQTGRIATTPLGLIKFN